ncbi:hypothetical protein BH18GEM1_BH18GEM1_10470 [soil metagenome]
MGVPSSPWPYFRSTISLICGSGTPASYCLFASRAISMQIAQVNPIGSGSTRGTKLLPSMASTKQS